MYDIIFLNSWIIFLIFPGVLTFFGVILFWLNFGHVLLKNVEETPQTTFRDGLNLFFDSLLEKNREIDYSEGIIWLILRLTALSMSYIFLLASIRLPIVNDYLILLLFLGIAAFFNLGYEITNPLEIRYRGTYALYELFTVIILFTWSLLLPQFIFLELRTNPWSVIPEVIFFQLLLLLLFLYSLGKFSSYLYWDKPTPFLLTPEQQSYQHITIDQKNPLEKSLQWFCESFSQSLFSLIITLLIGPSILMWLVGPSYPDWWYVIGLFMLWLFVLTLSLLTFIINFRYKTPKLGRFLQWGGFLLIALFISVLLGIIF